MTFGAKYDIGQIRCYAWRRISVILFTQGMRILHTSDWHLGDRLLGEARHGEFRAFLDWLLEQMQQHAVEALLVSGDLFDTRDPGAPALEMFNDFLSRADSTGCRHIILTAGNHDGVPVLDAASPLLQRYHARLVSRLSADTAGECLVPLCGRDGEPQALVCAVPYLRPSDMSRQLSEEALGAGENAYILGVQDVLDAVAQHAEAWRAEHPGCPVLAMAHLTVCGAAKSGSELDIIIGGLEAIGQEAFAEVFDYVALGHIHKGYSPDGGRLHYCGSPLPMSIDEAAYAHHVLLVDATAAGVQVQKLPVPVFAYYTREVCHTKAELDALPGRLQELAERHGGAPIHLELHYHGSGVENLQNWAAEHLPQELVAYYHASMWREGDRELDNLELSGSCLPTVEEMFEHKLAAYSQAGEPLSDAEKECLRGLFASVYQEALSHEN